MDRPLTEDRVREIVREEIAAVYGRVAMRRGVLSDTFELGRGACAAAHEVDQDATPGPDGEPQNSHR